MSGNKQNKKNNNNADTQSSQLPQDKNVKNINEPDKNELTPKTKEPVIKEKKVKEKKKKNKEDLEPISYDYPVADGQRIDQINDLFKTPPAGVYPKTDAQGRVIKYKKRGGVFAFFMGIFTSFFILIFCLGLGLSYFYYCYKIEDVGKTLGIDTSIFPQETTNKTANELVSILLEYKGDMTNMTLNDAKDPKKFGFNLQTFLEVNLGIELQGDVYELEITVNEETKKVGDFKLQEIALKQGNAQKFINALRDELYKITPLSSIFKLAGIDVDQMGEDTQRPIFSGSVFNITPNPTFDYSATTYTVNFSLSKVTAEDFSTPIEDDSFSIAGVQFEISSDRQSITISSNEQTIDLIYEETMKSLKELTIDDLLHPILENYIGGEYLTIGFLQEILLQQGQDPIIDTTDPEYQVILNTNINNLKIDELLDSISIKGVQKLIGNEIFPTDDPRYTQILEKTIGNIKPSDFTADLQFGAVIDLLNVDLPDIPLLSKEDFRNTYINNLNNYLTGEESTVAVKDLMANAIDEIYAHDYFVEDSTNIFLEKDDSSNYVAVYKNKTIQGTTYSTISSINDKPVLSYTFNPYGKTYEQTYHQPYGKQFLLYDNYFYKMKSTTINSNAVEIDGVSYAYDQANSKLIRTEDEAEIAITNNIFVITQDLTDSSPVLVMGYIQGASVIYFSRIDESEVVGTGKAFNLTFEKNDNGWMEETITLQGKIFSDNHIEFLDKLDNITENTFTIGETQYTINTEDKTVNGYKINSKSTASEILLYTISNLKLKDIIAGKIDEYIADDENINSLLLTDILGEKFTGLLSHLNGVTLKELLQRPMIIIDRISELTLGNILGIDESSSALLQPLKDITLDDLMRSAETMTDAMRSVSFADLGLVDENNPVIMALKDVTIGDIFDNNLQEKIENIKLSELTGTTTGIMSILGDITIGDFSSGDAITNTLKSSYSNLGELLNQQIHYYPYVEDDDEFYYIIENESIADYATATNGIYQISSTLGIDFGATQTVEIGGTTYTLGVDESGHYTTLKIGTNTVGYHSKNVVIENCKFMFNDDDHVYIISGKYLLVFELVSTTYTKSSDNTKIISMDIDSTIHQNLTICSNTLNQAILSLRVNALFNGTFAENLTERIQNVRLAEILGDVSGNKLLNAIITNNNNVTISTLGDTIDSLTIGEVFSDADYTTGIFSLISYDSKSFENIELINMLDAINDFDIGAQTMEDLIDAKVIDFNTTYEIISNEVTINLTTYTFDGVDTFSYNSNYYVVNDGAVVLADGKTYYYDAINHTLLRDRNNEIKAGPQGAYSLKNFISMLIDNM